MKIGIAIVAMAGVAHASPTVAVHAGGGAPINDDVAGQTSSLIAGDSYLMVGGRYWSPVFSLDVRKLNGSEDVAVGDHTRALDARGVGVRGLAGIRLHDREATGLHLFGQISLGLEWQRSTWEEILLGPGPAMEKGTQHYSAVGGVVEPAVGVSRRVGGVEIGAQLSLAVQTETSMPIEVNVPDRAAKDVLFTLFVESRSR